VTNWGPVSLSGRTLLHGVCYIKITFNVLLICSEFLQIWSEELGYTRNVSVEEQVDTVWSLIGIFPVLLSILASSPFSQFRSSDNVLANYVVSNAISLHWRASLVHPSSWNAPCPDVLLSPPPSTYLGKCLECHVNCPVIIVRYGHVAELLTAALNKMQTTKYSKLK
jgi:hypothetical protein